MRTSKERATLLRRALLANADFSILFGVGMLVSAEPFAAFLGFAHPAVLLAVGAVLVLFAAATLWLAARSAPPLGLAKLIVAMDAGWVLASALLLLAGPELFNAEGRLVVGVVAGAVALIALLEALGVRRALRWQGAGA